MKKVFVLVIMVLTAFNMYGQNIEDIEGYYALIDGAYKKAVEVLSSGPAWDIYKPSSISSCYVCGQKRMTGKIANWFKHIGMVETRRFEEDFGNKYLGIKNKEGEKYAYNYYERKKSYNDRKKSNVIDNIDVKACYADDCEIALKVISEYSRIHGLNLNLSKCRAIYEQADAEYWDKVKEINAMIDKADAEARERERRAQQIFKEKESALFN